MNIKFIKHITLNFPLHGSMKGSLLEQPTINKNFIIKYLDIRSDSSEYRQNSM
jgi:hypothetical protein